MAKIEKTGGPAARYATATLAMGLVGALWATAAQAEVIKVGAPIPVTGPYSSDGQVMEKGLKLAIDELNASGGLLGQQLELHVFDIGDLTPDKLLAAATSLVEKEGVATLINGYGGMGPDIPAFCPYQQAYIHNDATSNVVELRNSMNCANIFMGSDYDENYGRITFQQLMALGHEFPSKKIAIVHGPYDWELNSTKGAAEAAQALGWEVVLNEEVPYETTQWSGIISKLRDADPALVYMELLDPAGVATFTDRFRENPPKHALLYLGYTLSVPAYGEIVAQGKADGVLGMTLSAQRDNDKGRAFSEAWRKAFAEEPPFSISAQIYDEMMMWAEAVKKAGSVTDHEAIRKAILETPYEGVTGRIVFNAEQYVPSADDTVPTQLLQVQGKKTVQVMVGTQKAVAFVAPPWLE